MRLQGLHHITMIMGDAPATVEFYADVLGLRLVKKTVNFDAPDAYHLYFGDEQGTPGSILTWFEFAGAAPGRPGLGDVHTIALGVPSQAALDFWAVRLDAKDTPSTRAERALRFADRDGLQLELVVADDGNPPLRAAHPEVPYEHAITGVEGGEYRLDGDARHVHRAYDPASSHGEPGAGTVHHIAWASQDADQVRWQERIRAAGGRVTDVRDRDCFTSIYFREPRGVLFEIATLSPGFAIDEDPEHLGEELRLPQQHAHLRERLERALTPLSNPRRTRETA